MALPAARSTTMSAAIINVPVGVGDAAWRRCFLRTARRGEVFGINENLTAAQRNLYERLADDMDLGHHGLRGPNPVFWDQDRWQFVDGRRTPLHGRAAGALARRWPGFNAGRELTDVTLEDRDTGEQVGAICTHWVPRGEKVNDRWRNRMRRLSRRRVLKAIRRHLRAGRVVWLFGDFNDPALLDLAARINPELGRFRWIRGEGIDKVGVAIPRGVALDEAHGATFKAPTDHHRGISARATWRTQ